MRRLEGTCSCYAFLKSIGLSREQLQRPSCFVHTCMTPIFTGFTLPALSVSPSDCGERSRCLPMIWIV